VDTFELVSRFFRWVPGERGKCKIVDVGDCVQFKLYNTKIAEFDGDKLSLFTEGYYTYTTLEWLNTILAEYEYRYDASARIFRKNYRYYLMCGAIYPFFDGVGISIEGKVIPPRNYENLYEKAKKLAKWKKIVTLATMLKAVDEVVCGKDIAEIEKHLMRSVKAKQSFDKLERLFFRALVETTQVNNYLLAIIKEGSEHIAAIATNDGFSLEHLKNGKKKHSVLTRILEGTYNVRTSWSDNESVELLRIIKEKRKDILPTILETFPESKRAVFLATL